jgi:hypothetical protein
MKIGGTGFNLSTAHYKQHSQAGKPRRVLYLQEMPSDVQGGLAPAPSHVHLDILYGLVKVNLYSNIGIPPFTNSHLLKTKRGVHCCRQQLAFPSEKVVPGNY